MISGPFAPSLELTSRRYARCERLVFVAIVYLKKKNTQNTKQKERTFNVLA